jgi:predicted DNA-binding ribbon-helix-helix protein
MCRLFAHQPQRNYESQTRSLRIGGHATSIRLETLFWDKLEDIAAKEGTTLAKFLTTLHDEVLNHHGEVNNFASLLRCCCLVHATSATADLPPYAADIAKASSIAAQ